MLKKHALDALIGLLVSMVLLLVIEGVLWAAGVGAASSRTELSRGFDADAVYIVPAEGGGWHTRMGAGTYTENVIPPRSDLTRVILFGGSNTAGFPRRKLEDYLNAGLERRQYEVINLGRPGYGSERVSILFDQALLLLDPDIVVLYLGHNEFVEGSFTIDIERSSGGGWIDAIADRASRTRAAGIVADALSLSSEANLDETSTKEPKKPEAWEAEFSKFADFTYDQTELYYEAFGQNLRKMMRHAEIRGVRVLMSTVIYNRFSAPYVSTFPPGMLAEDQLMFETLHEEARSNLPPFVRALLPSSAEERLFSMHYHRGKGTEAHHVSSQLPGRRPCTGPFADMDPGLPATKHWFPRVWPFFESLEKFHRREFGTMWRDRIAVAERKLLACLELCPDHPQALFELGLVHHLLRRGNRVIAGRLEQAARYDRAPRKASGAVNEIVRQVAAEFPKALFVDGDELFAENMPMRLVGWEWMLDHCHLNVGARLVLMREFAEALRERWPTDEDGR